MAETTVIRRTDLSGTTFVVDVTGLALDSNISVRDFSVTHNGLDVTSSYTKTSATQISYAGSSIVLGTRVEVRRLTSLSFAETSYIGTTTAVELTNSLTKLKKRVDELDALVQWQSSLIQQGGLTLGNVPILDNVYGASWDGDTSNAPSRNAVYDRIQSLPATIVNNTAYGASWNGDSIQAPSRDAVYDKFELDQVNRTKLVYLGTFGSENIGTFASSIPRQHTTSFIAPGYTWSTSFLTVGETGRFLLVWDVLMQVSGGTLPSSFDVLLNYGIAGVGDSIRVMRNAQATSFIIEPMYSTSVVTGVINAGQTIQPFFYASFAGGSGFTAQTDRSRFAVIKLS